MFSIYFVFFFRLVKEETVPKELKEQLLSEEQVQHTV